MQTATPLSRLENLIGTKGTHYDLASMLRGHGFDVVADSDDNERSEVRLPGFTGADGAEIVVAEIVGDADAVIR